MPSIKPISDLRNYTSVLKACHDGEPVFLTKNGRGCYVLMDIAEYDKQQATFRLLAKLSEAEDAVANGANWQTPEEVRRHLGL